jgi:ABC-type polysaccharide/polyol phosphate transport system ATPase subunit
MTGALIDLKDVSVSYFLRKTGDANKATEEGSVGAPVLIGKRYLEIAALKNISLTIQEGERVGLIGINGSGKSTLLKLCAGALSVQSGSLNIVGEVSPQFSLGAGLKSTLSGRQNARLKCLYMGLPQRDISRYVEDVKRLSGLGGYFELPIQSYSAGMKSRLVMSLLRMVRGEILIMDEWINAADASLSEEIGGLQEQLIKRAKILLLASHSRRVLETWVDKLVWLHRGKLRAVGGVSEVFDEYTTWRESQRANKAAKR